MFAAVTVGPGMFTVTVAVAVGLSNLTVVGSGVSLLTEDISITFVPLVGTIALTASENAAVVAEARLEPVHVIAPVPFGCGVMQVKPIGAVIDWKVVLAGVA